MAGFWRLTGFGIRRCLKGCLRMAGTFFVAALGIAVLVFAAYKTAEKKGALNPAVVDVALEEEDYPVSLLLSLAGNMPSVKSVSKLVITDNETAEQDIENGTADAAVFVPAGLYEAVDTGVNTHVRVLIREGSGIRADVFRELVTDAVSILRSSEACVYTRGALAGDQERQTVYDETAHELYDVVSRRSFVFREPEIVSSFAGSLRSYYSASLLCALVFIFASCFSFSYGNEDKKVFLLLRRNGLGLATVLLSRFMSQFVSCLCLGMPVAVVMVLTGVSGFGVFPAAALASAAAALWSMIIFSVLWGSEHRDVIYAAATWAMFLCGGGLIPVSFIRLGIFSGILEQLPYARIISIMSGLMS